MLTPVVSDRFKRDVRRLEKRGKDMSKLRAALELLLDRKDIPARYRDHPLKGDLLGFRDLHLEPDWVLIYRVDGDTLQLARMGMHSDLFGE